LDPGFVGADATCDALRDFYPSFSPLVGAGNAQGKNGSYRRIQDLAAESSVELLGGRRTIPDL
jgi:hypothetical protein